MKSYEPPKGIQTLVHYLEVGAGQVWLRRLVAVVLVVLFAVIYQWTEARNFSAPDAMDAAQLGRNLAEGRGFTTSFIRPLSLHLQQTRAAAVGGDPRAVLTAPHADISNPPVYPLMLAALFKVMPAQFRYGLPTDQFFRRPYAEVFISAMNLGLFALVVGLVAWLGRRMFDPTVGFLAAGTTLVTEHFWRFANAGLPTLWLMVLVLLLVHVLVSFDRAAGAPLPSAGNLFGLALAAGILVGVAAMTRYAFAWLVVPVAGFLCWRGAPWRGRLMATLVLTTAVLMSPWLYRTWKLSGHPFGTELYSVIANTETYAGDRLERSQNPVLSDMHRLEPVYKLVGNLGAILRDEVPRLGGSWLTAFFLVGLLVPFHNATRNRIRWFLLTALLVLTVVQAATRTSLTSSFGTFTGENLLVVLAPLAFVYGAGVVVLLLDQIEWPAPLLRTLVLNVVLIGLAAPFLITCLPPRTLALSDPPYRPAIIREFAGFTPPSTFFMSDIPWAVAWYGPRECLWATLRVQENPEDNVNNRREDFFVFTEGRRPVQAVYLSPYWADQPMRARFFGDPDFAWGRYYLDVMLRQNIPLNSPLKHILGGSYMVNGHFLAADRDYWNQLDR